MQFGCVLHVVCCMLCVARKFVRVCVCVRTLAIAIERLKVKKGRGRAGKNSDRVAKGRREGGTLGTLDD